jgi:hypothetical protein
LSILIFTIFESIFSTKDNHLFTKQYFDIFTLNKKNIIHPYLQKSDIYKDQTYIYKHFVVTNHEQYNPKVTFVFSDLFVKAKSEKKNNNNLIENLIEYLTLSINLLAN